MRTSMLSFVMAAGIGLAVAGNACAGPTEDVAAATRAWVDAMNRHDAKGVAALYDGEKIRVYGNISINTGRYTFSELHDDKPVIRPARFSMVFINRGGRWLIVDHHSSAVPVAH